jgi:hypothetical protein
LYIFKSENNKFNLLKFENMNQEISQGYGSPEDMMAPSGDQLAGQEVPQEGGGEGGDMEAMLAEGVQAFMETQDPEIAVQVVMMLAEAMGLSEGAGAPPAGPPQETTSAPMAKNGGKFGWFGSEGNLTDFHKFVSK